MKRAICLISVVASGFAAGCGGGDDSTPKTIVSPTVQTPSSISKDRYITEGDGICAEVNAALGSLSDTSSSSAASQRAELYSGMVDKLRNLGTPKDDEGLAQVLSAGDDLVSAERDAASAAAGGDDAALASAQSDAASAESDFASAAGSFGFKECGNGPSTPATTAPSGGAPVTPAAPTVPAAPATTTPVSPAPAPGTTGAGGGTAGTGTGGGSTGTGGGSTGTGTGGTSGSGGVGPG
jgi:hypothetical protein